ncbi:MAG: ABC transporter ATP-binding protein [archaeon]
MLGISASKTKRILAYAKPHLGLMALVFLVMIVATALGLVNPYLMKILIDDVLVAGNLRLFAYVLGAYIVVMVIAIGVTIALSYYSTLLTERIALDVRRQLFNHIESMSLGFFKERKTGDIVSRLMTDVYGVQSYITTFMNGIVLNIITLVIIFAITMSINWQITLISLYIVPFYIWAEKYYGNLMRKQRRKLREQSADMLGFLEENINFVKLVKRFHREEYAEADFKRRAEKMLKLDVKASLTGGLASSFIALVTFLPLLVILGIGGYQVIKGMLTIGGMIAIYTYIGKLFEPIDSLNSSVMSLQGALASVDRVFEFLDKKEKIVDAPDSVAVKSLKGEIEFKKVSFKFKDKVILDNASFRIKPGEQAYLIGASGSGKSTIGDLIFRFYDPDKGQVLIDGMDVKKIKIGSLRERLGIGSQELILFNTTIADNIRFGKTHAKMEEVKAAAKTAQAADFIEKMPEGYETVVGPGGGLLSGGQKQRISLSRTILHNPDIYILDEVTTGLDPESEKKIESALREVTKGKTTVYITHKLRSAKGAKRILFLRDGKIVEDGSFDALLKKKGDFYKFYKEG